MRHPFPNALLALSLAMTAGTTLAYGLPDNGTAPATGRFVAEDSCPLFQSKRRRTNPGMLQTSPGKTYPVREVARADGAADWLRVDSGAEAQEPLRWVEARCGRVSGLAAVAQDQPQAADSCRRADSYDAQVLALSWQPGFCEQSGQGLAECRNQHAGGFDATHFTLHGLWPNKRGCHRDYGYCGQVRRRPSGGFCHYPALDLTPAVRRTLAPIMPSVGAGTCLQRHEYWKHGSCRDTDPNAYFRVAAALTEQVNASSLVSDFIQPNIGKTVDRSGFDRAFDRAFGKGAHRRVSMNCRGGMLTEMQIALPTDTPPDASIAALIAEAGTRGRGSCRQQFFIDPAGLSTR